MKRGLVVIVLIKRKTHLPEQVRSGKGAEAHQQSLANY